MAPGRAKYRGLHVRRSKRGSSSVHPIQGAELTRTITGPARVYVGARRSDDAQSFHTLIARLGERAGMPFPIHPHMLRHGPAATHWRTRATTRERCKRGLGIAISGTTALAANVPRPPYSISLRTASSPLVKLAYRLDRTV